MIIKDFNYIIKRVIIGVLIAIILFTLKSCKVNAAVVSGCIDSGQSLSGIAKIGANYVGSSYFYETAPQTWSQKALSLSFCTDLQDYPTLTGKDKLYFTVDYCVNGGQPDFAIYSSYYNEIDYTYFTGQTIYLAEGEWSKAYCYRSFIKLRLNYSSNVGTQVYNFTTYTNDNNIFALYGFENYNKLSRYTDLVYYNSDDYNNALYNARIIGQNNNIIQNQQDTTDAINDLNDTIKDDSTPTNTDFNDAINSVNSALPSNSTISSLVTMPITFLQKIIAALNGTCSPVVIGELYDYNMVMPCINPADYVGIIWNIIDIICAGFFAFYFGKKLVVIFHNITSMREGGLEQAYD